MKKSLVICLSFLMFIGLSACTLQEQSKNPTEISTKQTIQATIRIKVEGKVIEEKNTSVQEKTTVYDLLKQEVSFVDDNGFITQIDEYKQNPQENKYWLYTINGKQAQKGVKDTFVKNNDNIEFTLEKIE